MLMDLFFELAPSGPGTGSKKRVHFHAFMQDVHARIHAWRQHMKTAKERSADPIPPLAEELAGEAQLLCFDEFAVTDVADAMLLARLFTGLFNHGVTVVATSNVVPDNLYLHGLNRSFFLPFIALVKTRMVVVELASDTDYRMEKLINGDVYMTGDDADQRFNSLWSDMTDGLLVEPAVIAVSGRETVFDLACGGLIRKHLKTCVKCHWAPVIIWLLLNGFTQFFWMGFRLCNTLTATPPNGSPHWLIRCMIRGAF